MLDIWTTAKFSRMIEKLSVEINAPVMDTVVHYCERHDMEIESAAKLINSKLKRKMYGEANHLNMVKDDEEIRLKYGFTETDQLG